MDVSRALGRVAVRPTSVLPLSGRFLRMVRRLVALFGHAPGLWIVYREKLQPELRRANLMAVAATLIAMAAIVCFLDEARWIGVLVAWLVGHLSWGAYLARRLPARAGSDQLGS